MHQIHTGRISRLLAAVLLISVLLSADAFSIQLAFADDATPAPATTDASPPATNPSSTSPAADSAKTPPASDSQTGTAATPPPATAQNGANAPAGSTGSGAPSGTSATSTAPTTVTTGDASSSSDTQTAANTTAVNTPQAAPAGGNTGTTTVATNNTSDATNTIASVASSGGNSAAGGGPVSVQSGDAYASANVINAINTTLLNSDGLIYLLNRLFGGTIDLSSVFNTAFSHSPSGCNLSNCSDPNVSYNASTTNSATITNDVVVRAQSGGNRAASASSATIDTGNAYAGANVFNAANFTAIDSNYLLIGLNNLGTLNGDIVLPGSDFFTHLLAGASNSSAAISTANSANVDNNVAAQANSGSNSGSGNGVDIATGNAGSDVSASNQVNGTYIGGKPIYLLFRVSGNWAGHVFGLPPGLTWTQTPNGLLVYNDPNASQGGSPLSQGSLNITTANKAKITNNVQVMALTGDNHVDAASGSIHTGNAFAGANIINIANTTIIGTNWILAIFNIVGDWNGNLDFGRPNLWIGGAASVADHEANPGDPVTFTFTIANHGNADSTGSHLMLAYDHSLITFPDVPDTGIDVSALRAGHAKDITATGVISREAGPGVSVQVDASLTSPDPEADPSDNTEHIAFLLHGVPVAPSTYVPLTPDSKLTLTKTASASETQGAGTIDYRLEVKNEGMGPAYHAELFDTIRDVSGNILTRKTWPLNTIQAGEDIVVTYTAQFAVDTPPGIYSTDAMVKATTRNPSINPFYGVFGFSNEATSTITIFPPPPPVTVNPVPCQPLLTNYLGPTQQNDPQDVFKLQGFLRNAQGFSTVNMTGVYDAGTRDAVNQFQEKYRADILEPWGYSHGTGNVYYTTEKKINELQCQGDPNASFSLSSEQAHDMALVRAGATSPHASFITVGLRKGKAYTRTSPYHAHTATAKNSTQSIAAAYDSIETLINALPKSLASLFKK